MNIQSSGSVLCVALLAVSGAAWAGGDLNDGISSYTDNSIGSVDRLGSPDINVGYIVLRAKSQAASGATDTTVSPLTTTPMANINSVVLEPGSSVTGDIIIIDRSSGAKTQVITASQAIASGLGLDLNSLGLGGLWP